MQFATDEQLASTLAAGCDPVAAAEEWDEVWTRSSFDWRVVDYGWPENNDGLTVIRGVLHPDTLTAERVRITIEYKATGPDPFVEIELDNGPSRTNADSKAIQGEVDWRIIVLTGLRDGDDAFGECLDMFTYSVRDVEVRRFQVEDIGQLGDVNLDGLVNQADLQVVTQNSGVTGDLEVEDGDANADGVVNTTDANIVVQDMPE